MVSNYCVSYLFFSRRIFRTLKNIFSAKEHGAVTVLEHRLKDLTQRKKWLELDWVLAECEL